MKIILLSFAFFRQVKNSDDNISIILTFHIRKIVDDEGIIPEFKRNCGCKINQFCLIIMLIV